MPDASTKEALTNTTEKSCVEVSCDCNIMWSLAQQFSTKRLCVDTGDHKGELAQDYAVRARRIAATYARFYLEVEGKNDPEKVGRYYWMALGAFASKTVACTFEAWQVRTMTLAVDTVWEGLGKGNLWLFCDISAWHWYHKNYPDSFDRCLRQRNAMNYSQGVKTQLESLPWKKEALRTISHFTKCDQIKLGFDLVKKIENATDDVQKQRFQFEHLLAIADHEQRIILQPLIYDDKTFSKWVARQRAPSIEWATPDLELVFTHQCKTTNEYLKSVAPDDMKLEIFLSRMDWINAAATKFHRLMIRKQFFMESELRQIATWVDLPDVETLPNGNAL